MKLTQNNCPPKFSIRALVVAIDLIVWDGTFRVWLPSRLQQTIVYSSVGSGLFSKIFLPRIGFS